MSTTPFAEALMQDAELGGVWPDVTADQAFSHADVRWFQDLGTWDPGSWELGSWIWVQQSPTGVGILGLTQTI